jgi:hypothetical protein
MKQVKLLFLVLLVWSIIFVKPVFAASTSSSIGVSPSEIINTVLVPGAEFETKLVVSRSDATEAVELTVEISDSAIQSWISFPDGAKATLAAGEQRKEVKVKVVVPADTKLDTYKGSLRVTFAQKKEGQVNIVPGVRVSLELIVSEKKFEQLSIQYVTGLNTLLNEPYQLRVKIKNSGNVAARPDTLVYKISSVLGNELKTLNYTFDQDIEPFQSKEIVVYITDKEPLPIGEYIGKISIIDNNKEIFSDSATFSVLPPQMKPTSVIGTIEEQLSQNKLSAAIIILLIITLILFGLSLVMIFFVYKKNDRSKKDTDN